MSSFDPVLPALAPYETRVTIRRASSYDVPAILTMHERLSSDSRHARYHGAYTPGYREIYAICRLGGDEGAAWVATVDSVAAIVGLAYYVTVRREPGPIAELAFLVEDRFQGMGIGRELTQRLVTHAQAQGIRELQAHVQPTNRRMLRLLAGSGYPIHISRQDGQQEVRLSLDPAATAPETGWQLPPEITLKWPEGDRQGTAQLWPDEHGRFLIAV